MPNNKSKRNDGIRKSLFHNHHSNNSFRQETSMNIKLLGESEMKNEILHGLKVSLHKIFINYRGENKVNLQWRNLPDIVLSAQTPLNSYHVPSDLMQ